LWAFLFVKSELFITMPAYPFVQFLRVRLKAVLARLESRSESSAPDDSVISNTGGSNLEHPQ